MLYNESSWQEKYIRESEKEIEEGGSPIRRPLYRRLQGYAFDPSLSTRLDTALMNKVVYKVRWELLKPGPIGEYIEVIDYDPCSGCFYEPVDLNHAYILAQDGMDLSEGDPRFHQQMVYAVSMVTIQNFEDALGRWIFWHTRGDGTSKSCGSEKDIESGFVQRLRIYPHGIREANAYYSSDKKALLFGYFPAVGKNNAQLYPGGYVFTSLSHDIITHELSHAVLDGIHPHFIEPSNPDCHAFHEAFADVVALFQHFTFPEVLYHQIAKTRGDLGAQNLLGELAQQFGQAIGHYGALRSALGYRDDNGQWHQSDPRPEDYERETEPHGRGAILVSAVFDAFLSIYRSRVADLLRVATGGTGILPEGEISSDLVRRLATEAVKTSKHILRMCIRALDYCPPVDITFGQFLRALITADVDLITDDPYGYRIAFIESFRRRGIYPPDLPTLSEESLRWSPLIHNHEDVKAALPPLFGDDPDAPPAPFFDQFYGALVKIIRENSQQQYPAHNSKENGEPSERRDSYIRCMKIRYHIEELFKRLMKKAAGSEEVFNALGALEAVTGLSLRRGVIKEWPNAKTDSGPEPSVLVPSFEVYSFRFVRRFGPDGQILTQGIIKILQTRKVDVHRQDGRRPEVTDVGDPSSPGFLFRGGCSIILDLNYMRIRYCIHKRVMDNNRVIRQDEYLRNTMNQSLYATYFGLHKDSHTDKYALLHLMNH